MAKPLKMPQVGQDIETAILSRWLVKEGDYVKEGDIYAEAESDKAAFDLEAEASGTVLKLLYAELEEVQVLEPIAWVGEPGEKLDDVSPADRSNDKKNEKAEKTSEIQSAAEQNVISIEPGKIAVSPSARRVAKEHGIDISGIVGTGPNGRIVKADVMEAAASLAKKLQPNGRDIVPVAMDDDREVPFSKMRKRIAERLSLSKQTIPHYYLFAEVNMSAALAWRKEYNAEGDEKKVSINDIVVKAAASALSEYRELNGHVADDKLIMRKRINIGIAVSTDDGLLVPVIPDADMKTVDEIGKVSKTIARDARRGMLKAGSKGTFTISNLGMHGISSFLPIINPPECAILGVGGLEKKLSVNSNSGFDICDMLTLTLACDHRAVDGARGADFLSRIKNILEKVDFIS